MAESAITKPMCEGVYLAWNKIEADACIHLAQDKWTHLRILNLN